MNCCLQKYTTDQFTYSIYYLFQDKLKIEKLSKSNKYIKRYLQHNFCYFFKLFSIGDSFEFKATREMRLI